MNIVTDFLDANTWSEALTLVAIRRDELFKEEARIVFEETARKFGQSQAALQILQVYLELLKSAGSQGPGAVIQRFRSQGETPKLTTRVLAELSQVHNAASARVFSEAYPQIVRGLIVQQILQGETFWLMLFTSASVVRYSSNSKKTQLKKTVVAIGEGAVRRKAFKVLSLSDGGFALTAPYHQARSGSMQKVPFNQKITGSSEVSASQDVPFHASDRVKLTYHVDGFVQFSGAGSAKILSGRDPDTGEPRGLGLFTRPLTQPVQSGPSVGCSIWGFHDFDAWSPRASEGVVLFEAAEDFYFEPDNPAGDNPRVRGYHISAFVFPAKVLEEAVGQIDTEDEISLRLPMNIYNRDTFFRVKLVRISADIVLGMIAEQRMFGLGSSSGFQLSGPSDGTYNMFAFYPALPLRDSGRDLDYKGAAK